MVSGGIGVFAHEIEDLQRRKRRRSRWTGTAINEVRLNKYRYLDLRRPQMAKNLLLRARVSAAARDTWTERGFV